MLIKRKDDPFYPMQREGTMKRILCLKNGRKEEKEVMVHERSSGIRL